MGSREEWGGVGIKEGMGRGVSMGRWGGMSIKEGRGKGVDIREGWGGGQALRRG